MQFFKSNGCVDSTIWKDLMDADKVYRKKARQELHKNPMNDTEQILKATSHKTAALWPPSSHL